MADLNETWAGVLGAEVFFMILGNLGVGRTCIANSATVILVLDKECSCFFFKTPWLKGFLIVENALCLSGDFISLDLELVPFMWTLVCC